MTMIYMDTQPDYVRQVCTADACRQGRASCPCPGSCQVPEDDDEFGCARGLVNAIVITAAAFAVCAVLVQAWA